MTTMEVPRRQRAAVKEGEGESARVTVREVDVQMPGPGEILVKINWTGLCASDKSLLRSEFSAFGVFMSEATRGIAGHEGAGVVVALGEGAERRWKIGDRAGIKWITSICGECEFCLNSTDEVHCVAQKNSGFSTPGTFQEYVVASSNYTTKIPDGVSDEEAGPIMCAGLTAYVGLKRSSVKPGQWIVVLGAGGGLGHLAIQYARAMGMRVIAVDGGDVKRDLCKKLGAEVFVDFSTTKDMAAEVMGLTKYGAHGVLATAGSKEAYDTAGGLLRPNGTVVVVGLSRDPTVIAGAPPIMMTARRLNFVGSVVGSLKDVEEALDFTSRGLVHPILSKGKLEDLDAFMDKMSKGELAGRAVLQVAA